MKIKILFLCFCLFLRAGFAQSRMEPEKPKIIASKGSDNATVILEYSIPKPCFVEILVFGRNGELFDIPVYEFKSSGSFKCLVNRSALPIGTYSVDIILDHNRENRASTGFRNMGNRDDYTMTRLEGDYLNRGIGYSGQSPEKAKLMFDTLLTKYPNFIDRGTAFANSFGVYMQTYDSLHLTAVIDSIEKYLPYSVEYLHISNYPPYFKKYFSIGIKYAKKAIEHIDDVPLPYRNSSLFRYQRSLAENYLANGSNKEAYDAFIDALTTFNKLPPSDRWYKYNSDVEIYISLASISMENKKYNDALEFYTRAVIKESENIEYWGMLQRCYSLANNSDKGYNEFKNGIISQLPKDEKSKPDQTKYVGKIFPPFSLPTLDGKKYDYTEIKGKVTVINYWAYWCGTCLEERPLLEQIYKEFSPKGLKILSMHASIGNFNNYKEEKELVENVLRKNPVSFPTLIESSDGKNNPEIGVNAVPTTVIIDKKGNIRFEEVGFDKNQFYDRVKKNVQILLDEK